MFKQIEKVNMLWVNDQIDILTNAQILIDNINQDYGSILEVFIEKFISLGAETKHSICKDHIFHNWLNEIKIGLINIYEKRDNLSNNDRLISILNLLKLTISIITKTELDFVIMPSFISKALFPATGFFFDFSSITRNNQITHCHYFPKTSELEIDNIRFKLCSYQHYDSIKIVNNNFDFFLDPTGDQYTIEFDDKIDVSAWKDILGEALEIIKTDASSYQLVRNFVTYLIPLKQKEINRNLSFSVRDLPNVIFKSKEVTPYLFGETLVHEADHQFFFATERFYKFWKSDVNLQKPIYFSPWRDDPRPLDGILKGLSSFARVSKYYSTVLTKFTFSQNQLESVGKMLLRRLTESELALKTISQSKQLSTFGIEYLKEINDTLNEVNTSAKKHLQYKKWREDAMRTINSHRENWNILNQ